MGHAIIDAATSVHATVTDDPAVASVHATAPDAPDATVRGNVNSSQRGVLLTSPLVSYH